MRRLTGLVRNPSRLELPSNFDSRFANLQASVLSTTAHLDRSPAQAILAASACLEHYQAGESLRRSRLLWLVDGAVVEEERLAQLPTEILQFTILANGDGLSSDLTGFSLLDNIEFRQRREEVLKAAGKVLSGYQADGDMVDPVSFSRNHHRLGHELADKVLRTLSGQARPGRQQAQDLVKNNGVEAISRDLGSAIDLLSGDKPAPPPEKRVEFVVRER